MYYKIIRAEGSEVIAVSIQEPTEFIELEIQLRSLSNNQFDRDYTPITEELFDKNLKKAIKKLESVIR